MPAKPKTALKAAAEVDVKVRQWDTYLAEATKDLEPWAMQLPDGEVLEVHCPPADRVEALREAQVRGDSLGMLVAVFGADYAPKLMRLTGDKPWVVRIRLVNDVMLHFGLSLAELPQF